MLKPPGSTTSFEEFVSAHADGLLRTAYLITRDIGDAEDLVQECLLRLSRRWSKVQSLDQPASYARRVLVRLAWKGTQHRNRRHAELLGPDSHPEAFGSSHELLVDDRDELRVALARLSQRQRTVLILRYYHDISEADVADMLGCSIGTVKSTASRGLTQLREEATTAISSRSESS
jgi:RNA polymerase sigma-70 factor (sigma-E family)